MSATPQICASARRQKLVDEIRALEAQAAGKRMELCMDLGLRTEAMQHMRDMNALTVARRAAAEVGLVH